MHYLFLLILALIPELAFAGPFDPPSGDISMKILDQIFGGLVSNGNDAFGSAIGTFNSAILVVGGILAAYTILAGTLGTAHDGEMLGKKFSSVWIPIRFCLGTALVLPVLPGGYCVMSALVMWAVKQGVGLAGMVWVAYMATPSVGANIAFPTTAQMQIQKVAEDAFLAGVCVEAHKKYTTESPGILGLLNRYDWKMALEGDTYHYGDHKGLTSFINKSECGWVKLPKAITNQTVATGASSTNAGYLGPLDNLFQAPDMSPLNTAHRTQTGILINKMNALAGKVVGDVKSVPTNADKYYKEIADASKAYMTGIQTVAQGIVNGQAGQAQNQAMKDNGWIMAGAYFNSIIVNNNKLTTAMNAFPTASGSVDIAKNTREDDDATKYMVGTQVLSARGTDYSMQPGSPLANKKEEEHKKADTGIGGRFANAIAEVFTAIDLYSLKNDTRHPLIVVNEMGSRLLTAWSVLAITVPSLSIATGWIPGAGPAISGFLSTAMSFMLLPITALVATGFAMAYVIPFMPFMIWLACAVGWVVQVVIAILAGPLWAVMHLHPSGDDMHGKGGNGYTLLLGLLLRPALLVFGFIASIVISSVIGEFINKIYFQVFSFSQGDGNGLLGFVGIIAGTAVYAVVMFAFIKKTFGIMHIIPDELLRWVGGQGDSVGSYAKTMQEGSSGGFAVLGAAVSNNTRGLGRGNGSGGKQITDKPFPEKPNGNIPLEGNSLLKPSAGSEQGASNPDSPKSFSDLKKASKESPKSEVQSEISKQSANNDHQGEFNAFKTNNKLDNALSMVGKENSPAFLESVKSINESKPDSPISKNIDSAYNKHLNNTFGSGTGRITAEVGGGSYHSPSANKLVDEYKDMQEKLSSEFGDSIAKSMLEGANVNALSSFKADESSVKNGGNLELKDYVKKEFSELEKNISPE